MKKVLSILLLSVSVFALSSCDSDEWKEKYGTPELALSNVRSSTADVYLYEEEYAYIYDRELEIRDILLEAAPYKSTKETKSTAERYFTYQTYVQPANSGPNYCKLTFYEDGLVKLHHKYSLGPHHYLYFSMNSDKAKIINDYIFNFYEKNSENA